MTTDQATDGVQVGPLIDAAAVAKVTEHIADATARGARVLTGGSPHARGGPPPADRRTPS